MKQGKSLKDYSLFLEPTPDTIYMFCYTSGTTGDPKGAMINHRGFISCAHLAD